MMDWILALVIVIPIVYFVMIVAHYITLTFIVWLGWDETDWFESLNKRNDK